MKRSVRDKGASDRWDVVILSATITSCQHLMGTKIPIRLRYGLWLVFCNLLHAIIIYFNSRLTHTIMPKATLNSTTTRLYGYSIAFMLLLLLSGCAKKIHFSTSEVLPAAQGTVKIKKDKNNNYAIDVSVKHLADPKRLDPSRDMYVAWVETKENGVQNIGRLSVSNSLKASLSTVSTYKPTRLFITAENDANIQYPGTYVVLNTRSF